MPNIKKPPQPVIARLVPGNPVKNSAALAAILNDSSEGFSEKYQVHKLVYFEEHGEMLSAIHREKRMKKWTRKTKIMLVEKNNLKWRDLYDDIVG